MMPGKAETSYRSAAFVSGLAIVIMTVAAVTATDLTIGNLIVPGDAAATTNNIIASESLFRAGLFSWLVILVCDVLAAWGLYIFLKPVSKGLSLLMAWFRLVYVAILGTSLLSYVIVLLLVSGDNYLMALYMEQLQALVLLLCTTFDKFWSIGLLVFGFHILLLGYLIYKSGYIPKFLGVMLLLACIGYLVTNTMNLLMPGFEELITVLEWVFIIPMLGEVVLGVWQLIKGVKVELE